MRFTWLLLEGRRFYFPLLFYSLEVVYGSTRDVFTYSFVYCVLSQQVDPYTFPIITKMIGQ